MMVAGRRPWRAATDATLSPGCVRYRFRPALGATVMTVGTAVLRSLVVLTGAEVVVRSNGRSATSGVGVSTATSIVALGTTLGEPRRTRMSPAAAAATIPTAAAGSTQSEG